MENTNVDVIDNQWVCSDCLMAIANDDFSGLDYYLKPDEADARANEIRAAIDRELPYQWVCDGPHIGEHAPECDACDGTGVEVAPQAVYENDDGTMAIVELHGPPLACETCHGTGRVDEPEGADTREFSWSACDCCGSSLGGSRHRCALIKHGD